MIYRLFVLVLVSLALLAGCTPERKFQPGTDYPEWSFDKPQYREPAKEPVPFVEGTNGRPDVYYSPQRLVFIKRPRNPDPRKAPRPAVFSTKDNGQTWKKEGHFGLEQQYFPLLAPQDGAYGICIIGLHRPDLVPANLQIQQIQVIDSTAPQVQLSISPEEGPYWIGQRIELSWNISDPHLAEAPAKLYYKAVAPGVPTSWDLIKPDLASSGTFRVSVEILPSGAKGLLLRVEATDQMGNIGEDHTAALEMLPFPPDFAPKEETTTTIVLPGAEPQPEQPESSKAPAVTPVPDDRSVEPETLPPLPLPEPETPVEPPAEPTGSTVPAADKDAGRGQLEEQTPELELAQAKPEPDTEMDELERLLRGISGPVFQGKVHQTPEPKPLAQAGPPSAPEPSTEQTVAVAPPEPEKAPAVEVVVARPMEEQPDKPIIKTASAEDATAKPVVDKDVAEGVELLVPPLVDKTAPVPTEPIVTVKPPAEPKAKPPLITAKPPVEPATIITLKPVPPTKQLPPPAPVVTTVSLSHGKDRMAKPWERLGNRAAAARDFYKHAPSLSNY